MRAVNLPTPLKVDAEANYSTKRGYVAYEIAVEPRARPNETCERFLLAAGSVLRHALELKPNWNPAQIYLALVYRVHSGVAHVTANGVDERRYSEKAHELFSSLLGLEPAAAERLAMENT